MGSSTVTISELTKANEAVADFSEKTHAEIAKLGKRRAKVAAPVRKLLSDLERVRAAIGKSAGIAEEIEALSEQRREEIGTAFAEARPANTTRLDAEIRKKEAALAVARTEDEAADAALPLIEQRLELARIAAVAEAGQIDAEVGRLLKAVTESENRLIDEAIRFVCERAKRAAAYEDAANHFSTDSDDVRGWPISNHEVWRALDSNRFRTLRGDGFDERSLPDWKADRDALIKKIEAAGVPSIPRGVKANQWMPNGAPNPIPYLPTDLQ
ncbi:hypothetical protein [Paraburkholderia kirstenboschensis]|uniref:Uncharacterized protein n=1 Tax=Paraburkholderia kirstenboschensis TaxID=1245436 RepID=A0ABZ0ES36_9BURK|nr:hypothetical protein [Paraburkholderia kirstenboschensis]WOD19416.1 hypothetical protein RW095_24560 [Paraburkholderia kirstenboschensis]